MIMRSVALDYCRISKPAEHGVFMNYNCIILLFLISFTISCNHSSLNIETKYEVFFGDTLGQIIEDRKTGIVKVLHFNDHKMVYAIYHYKNQKLHGITTKYCENGRVKSRVVFDQDKIVAILDYYNETGKALNIGELRKRAGYLYRFDCDGRLIESGPIVNGFRNGFWKKYYYDGLEIRDSILYIDGVSQDDHNLFMTFE